MIVLDWWMVVLLFVAFGICAWHCTTVGIRHGAMNMLHILQKSKVIEFRGNMIIPVQHKELTPK